MTREQWCGALFACIDGRNTRDFLRFLAPDALFRFGSAPPAQGTAAIGRAVDAFFGSIRSLSHRLFEVWSPGPDLVICRGEATYQRLDGRSVVLPFCNVFLMRGDEIARYEIYLDPTPLAAP
jgi:ketosteroid isomerase-like protein